MQITDSVSVAGTRLTDEGYLLANARTARTGIQKYLGAEMGRPDLGVVNVMRDEAEVFRRASLDTFSRIPVTDDHPLDSVDAESWGKLAAAGVIIGTTGDDVLRDGEYLKIGLKITDARAVKAIQDGKRELSVGYAAEIIWEDGVAPDGTPYQARQANIKANHIALVDAGRAGSLARIGDATDGGKDRNQWGLEPITDRKDVPMADAIQTRTVLIDGLSVVTTDAGAQALEKLTKQLTDAETTHAAAIADKDEEIGTLKADLKAARDAALTPEKQAQLVADRISLEREAAKINDAIKADGLTDADLRKAVVSDAFGEAEVKDASEAEIKGMFRALARDAAKADLVADAMKTGLQAHDADPWAFLNQKEAV